jgi:hypothetical protein
MWSASEFDDTRSRGTVLHRPSSPPPTRVLSCCRRGSARARSCSASPRTPRTFTASVPGHRRAACSNFHPARKVSAVPATVQRNDTHGVWHARANLPLSARNHAILPTPSPLLRTFPPHRPFAPFAIPYPDDIVADKLATGDLVLFARDCSLYTAWAAATCVARKRLSGSDFDQAGVVVLSRGMGAPMLLEQTSSGVKLRPYPARIKCSRSKGVIVRPLGLPPLSPAQQTGVDAFLTATVGRSAKADSAAELPATLLAAALHGRRAASEANTSVALVHAFYTEGLGLPLHGKSNPSGRGGTAAQSGAGTAPAGGLAMQDLAPPGQPLAGQSYGPPTWVRDVL